MKASRRPDHRRMTAPETPGRRGQVQVIEVVGHGTEEHYLVRWQDGTSRSTNQARTPGC